MPFTLLSHPMAITGESPLWDAGRQCLWWIDIQAQRLLRTTEDGRTSATPLPWQPGFVALGESSRLVIGLETGLFVHDPETGELEQVSDTESDRVTVRLNDGKPDMSGRLWFGSMDMTGEGRPLGRLYCRYIDGTIKVVREGIVVPNAIAPLPNGGGLTFVDTPSGRLELLTTDEKSGEVTATDLIHKFDQTEHADGACFDRDGNLLIAIIGPGEIRRLTLKGETLARYPTPVSRPTMPILGGHDGTTLFVTNQRRFLSFDALAAQPHAGGILFQSDVATAAPVFRVKGL